MVITATQQKWIKELISGKKMDRRIRSIYLGRIQKRIERELEMTEWLSKIAPHILNDYASEYEDLELQRHRRIKTLLRIIRNLNEDIDEIVIELIKDKTRKIR